MKIMNIIEYVYFFALLGGVSYLVWLLVAPFGSTLALAVIVATICYPLYERMLRLVPRQNSSIASLLTVLLVIVIVVLPLVILGSFILREALSVYGLLNSTNLTAINISLSGIESMIQHYLPTFSLDVTSYLQQSISFIAEHLLGIFTGTASTIFLSFIALIATFYFFRDGKYFIKYLVSVSPLKDEQDAYIMNRLATSVRSVVLGTVLVALIQGVLTAIGLTLFGFERSVLWGSIAAIGALIPGIGTTIVFVPAVVYSVMTGSELIALGVAVWGLLAVGLIDNLLGPYLMSRGNSLHPFAVLISVLGGISLFGPIGFILGPVILSFFTVLVELCSQYIKRSDTKHDNQIAG